MSFLILIYLSIFAGVSFIRSDWAVMIIIFALPSYLIRFNVLGLPATLLEAMILIAFAAWFLKNWRTVLSGLKEKIKGVKNLTRIRYPFDLEIILMLIVAFMAVAVAGFSRESLGIWKAYFFEPALFFILFFNVFGREALSGRGGKWAEKILWPIALSALSVSVLAVYQKITGQLIDNPLWQAAATRRTVSFFGYPNAVGLFLGPLVLLFTGWLAGEILLIKDKITNHQLPIIDKILSSKIQIAKICFIVIAIILSAAAIYFAKSKGAMLGIAAGIFLFGLLAGKKIRRITVGLAIVLAAGIFFYAPARNLAIREITLSDFSGEVRQQQWRETWEMLKDGRLLSGAGLSNYQNAVRPFHQEGIFYNFDNNPRFRNEIVWGGPEQKAKYWQPTEIYLYPHDIFLNFWTELGLAGLVLFIWIIVKFFYVGAIILKRQANGGGSDKFIVIGLISAMAAIVVHGLVDVPYFKNDLAVMFWLFVFMLSLINLTKKKAYEQF